MTITEACQVPKVFQNVNQTTRAKLVSYGRLRTYKKGEYGIVFISIGE